MLPDKYLKFAIGQAEAQGKCEKWLENNLAAIHLVLRKELPSMWTAPVLLSSQGHCHLMLHHRRFAIKPPEYNQQEAWSAEIESEIPRIHSWPADGHAMAMRQTLSLALPTSARMNSGQM